MLYRLKQVICFGEGAGANILARFAVCIVIVITLLLRYFVDAYFNTAVNLYSPDDGGNKMKSFVYVSL